MIEISIDGSGFAEIDALARRLSSLDRPLAEVGAYLERKAKLRFNSETAPDGAKWAPLRPSTLRDKKTRAILRETGVMAASISFRVAGNAVFVKPSVDYAIYHQTGVDPFSVSARKATLRFKVGRDGRSRFANKKRANFEQDVNIGPYTHPGIPARPFMGFEPDDPAAIAKIISAYLDG